MRMMMKFLNDESGQATTEYILMLSIMAGFAVMIIKNFIQPTYQKLSARMSSLIEQKFLGMDMHTFRVR